MAEVLYALEGSMAPAECILSEDAACSHDGKCCAGKIIWEHIYHSVTDVIEGITLEELVKQFKQRNGIE